ncbi:MAG: 30S ribosomal protein S18 [Candidatus Firestonebacteria bacterium]
MGRIGGRTNKKDKKKDRKKGRREDSLTQGPLRKKTCRFCAEKIFRINDKDYNRIKNFVTERAKILPRRYSGNCAKHQRQLTQAIKRARILGIFPFTIE